MSLLPTIVVLYIAGKLEKLTVELDRHHITLTLRREFVALPPHRHEWIEAPWQSVADEAENRADVVCEV